MQSEQANFRVTCTQMIGTKHGNCFPTVVMKPSLTGWPLVREKSGKFDFSSRSGKSQGILQIGQGNFKYQESQGKVMEFHNFGPKYVL